VVLPLLFKNLSHLKKKNMVFMGFCCYPDVFRGTTEAEKKHLYPLKTSPSGAISITCNRAKRPKTLETCAVGHGMGSKWDTRRCQKLGDPAVVGQFYPLVNIQKTMENHHFLWENQL
jgi:hypothetical protein